MAVDHPQTVLGFGPCMEVADLLLESIPRVHLGPRHFLGIVVAPAERVLDAGRQTVPLRKVVDQFKARGHLEPVHQNPSSGPNHFPPRHFGRWHSAP